MFPKVTQGTSAGAALDRFTVSQYLGNYPGNVPFTGDDVHFHETKPRSRSLKRMGTASRDAQYRSLPIGNALDSCDS